MKIRQGFVSNSSSSSFLIYGVCFSGTSEIIKALDLDADGQTAAEVEDDTRGFLGSAVNGLTVESPSGSGIYYIGLSWDEVKDSETGKEFKQRVFEKLEKVFPKLKKSELGTHAEAWHD